MFSYDNFLCFVMFVNCICFACIVVTLCVFAYLIQGGSNMTGTDLCVSKPHWAAAVRPCESEATTSTLPSTPG